MPVDIEKTKEKVGGQERSISGPQVLGRFSKAQQDSRRDGRELELLCWESDRQ